MFKVVWHNQKLEVGFILRIQEIICNKFHATLCTTPWRPEKPFVCFVGNVCRLESYPERSPGNMVYSSHYSWMSFSCKAYISLFCTLYIEVLVAQVVVFVLCYIGAFHLLRGEMFVFVRRRVIPDHLLWIISSCWQAK